MLDQSTIEHLLRRTEYVARPERVADLTAMPTIGDAVDDVLDVVADPGRVEFASSDEIVRGDELTHFWLDRMAHDSPRPVQEKMAFFWHGHFCSEINKVRSGALMRDQIDLFRTQGLSNFRTLTIQMATQVAMLRYLDNNLNRRTSPNQNFGRELLELFVLGVGNYTEDDVEASAAAWTGHSDNDLTGAYVWRDDWHDSGPKQFLGRTINTDDASPVARRAHGAETVNTMLGNGVVPTGPNAGRPSRAVAAEFISRKLWTEFAGTSPPAAVVAHLRDVALDHDFDIRPWVRALLVHDAFYAPGVRIGRVRSPVELMVAILVATGRRSAGTTPLWRMTGMGQRPLRPPDVSGWRHNAAFVNAAAMSKRTETALIVAGTVIGDDGVIRLGQGEIAVADLVAIPDAADAVDAVLDLMGITLAGATRDALVAHTAAAPPEERTDLVHLVLLAHDLHLA